MTHSEACVLKQTPAMCAGDPRNVLGQAVGLLGGQGRLRGSGRPAARDICHRRDPLCDATPALDSAGAR